MKDRPETITRFFVNHAEELTHGRLLVRSRPRCFAGFPSFVFSNRVKVPDGSRPALPDCHWSGGQPRCKATQQPPPQDQEEKASHLANAAGHRVWQRL